MAFLVQIRQSSKCGGVRIYQFCKRLRLCFNNNNNNNNNNNSNNNNSNNNNNNNNNKSLIMYGPILAIH